MVIKSCYQKYLFNCWFLFYILFVTYNNIQNVQCAIAYRNSTIGANINNANKNCQLNLNEIPSGEPLYLLKNSGRYNFFIPENLTNIISNNRQLILNCPGKRNSLISDNRTLNVQEIEIKCQNGDFVTDKLEILKIKNISCDKTPSAELQVTEQRCGGNSNSGYIYKIGFELSSGDFLTLFTICYNNQNENTYYSKHIINGKAIQYSIKESKRTSFKSTGMSAGSSKAVQQIYQKSNQNTRFQNLFGANQKYIDNSNFLARGHLTPDADFIFPCAQLATYFYINVAPEFQIINSGNWKRIENLARNLASTYKQDFEIYTGIHGQLKLPNSKGEKLSIFLDDNRKIEVPKWFWKVIQNTKTKDAIVMLTLNNPYATDGKSEEFCSNVCDRAGINIKKYSILSKGYTYCCEVNSFKNIVKDLPSNFTSSNLLDCSKISEND